MLAERAAVVAAEAVVLQNGKSLQHVSQELRGDREVVLAAVAQDGRALQYASATLRGDWEVVVAAVAQDGSALQHASGELKADKEAVLAAAAARPGKAAPLPRPRKSWDESWSKAQQAATRVFGKDKDWSELLPIERKAVTTLGWDEAKWDGGQYTDASAKKWAELCPTELQDAVRPPPSFFLIFRQLPSPAAHLFVRALPTLISA
jgi:hypothetical protein